MIQILVVIAALELALFQIDRDTASIGNLAITVGVLFGLYLTTRSSN